jgi:hypothetical protein
MVTPDVVGRIDPVCLVEPKTNGMVTGFATHDGIRAESRAAWRR